MSINQDLSYARDFVGYGENPPHPNWPDSARVAVSIVLNVEAGAELSVADGDEENESIYEIIEQVEGVPNRALASHFEYGPRVGYWRIIKILERFGMPCTVSSAGRAIERSPWLASDAVSRGHEVSAHGYRWEGHSAMAEESEREVIARTVRAIERACGIRPAGWHTKGATSPNTRRLLVEEGFLYDSDAYNDDLPYPVEVSGKTHIIVPYAFDTNDMRFMPGGTFVTAGDFSRYCIDAFDALWEQGEHAPAMMSIGVHPRLLGRPGRIAGLELLLQHIQKKGRVWVARRDAIANHWLNNCVAP